ncbi:MAG: o-succinylbenzoate synthase [Calditrichaeota bacterium]|nr:MAG: o-succinylbenzoate synthase [Calditrichota bacterium]
MKKYKKPSKDFYAQFENILKTEITLQKFEILEVAIPQVESFRSAVGVRNERLALIVKWTDENGNFGIGESSCRPDPFFNNEFVNGSILILKDYVFPLLEKKESVKSVLEKCKKMRGWNFTVSAVIDAVLDLIRKRDGNDFYSKYETERTEKVPVGISLGLYKTEEKAVERVGRAISAGFKRVKLKISPKMNVRTLEAIREEFPNLKMGFDANGSFQEVDENIFQKLVNLNPVTIEQPFPPTRVDLGAELKTLIPATNVCLDESITGIGELISAYKCSALDEVNVKPGRVGGQFYTVEILEFCKINSLPAWIGGMFESGIGRTNNLRVASMLPNALAHDLSPSNRYFVSDIVKNPIEMSSEGLIDVPKDFEAEIEDAIVEQFLQQRIVLEK